MSRPVTVRATYYPLNYRGDPMVTVELSLPKALYGNNFTMIADLALAIDAANNCLARCPALPALDIAEGVLIRIDPCYNHLVGHLVPEYINAIGTLDYPHRRTKLHRNEGAEFRAKHATTKFYDKLRESHHPDASGILRHESTFLSPKRIVKLLATDKPTLRDVTPEWAAMILTIDLELLRLRNRTIATADTALATLCERYGPNAGAMYWALLMNQPGTTRAAIANKATLHPRSLDGRLKAIVDSGIAPTLTESTEPLPPLEIRL